MKFTHSDNLGKCLRTMRGEMTLREAAKETGLNFTYISKIENNREVPSWQGIKSMLKAYKASVDFRPFAYWQLSKAHKEQLAMAIEFAKEQGL